MNEVQISPVHADIVAAAVEYFLIGSADAGVSFLGFCNKILPNQVARQFRGRIKVHLKAVSLFRGGDLVKDVRHRARHDFKAIHQKGSEDRDGKVACLMSKGVDRGGGIDGDGGLLECLSIGLIFIDR